MTVIYGYLRLFTVFSHLAHFVNRRSQKVAILSVTPLKTAHLPVYGVSVHRVRARDQ